MFQSGSCSCQNLSASNYYDHPKSCFWGGARSKSKRGGGSCSLMSESPVVSEVQQRGKVLYGGRKQKGGDGDMLIADSVLPTKGGKRKPRKQKGGDDDDMLIADSVLPTKGGKRKPRKQKGGDDGDMLIADSVLPSNNYSLETSGGKRKPRKQKGGIDLSSFESELSSGMNTVKGGRTKKQPVYGLLTNFSFENPAVLNGGKRPRGRPRKQTGGGSDWIHVVNSRGPVNYPTQCKDMYDVFNKTAPYYTNAELEQSVYNSPMFQPSKVVGYNDASYSY